MSPMVIEEGGAVRLRTQCLIKHRKIILGVVGCLLSVAIIATLVGVFSGKDEGDEKESVTEAISAVQLKETQHSDDVAVENFSLSMAFEEGTEAFKTTSVGQNGSSDFSTKQTENAVILTTIPTTTVGSSTTVKPSPKTLMDVPKTDVPDSEASISMSILMSTTTFVDPSVVAKSDADEEIIPSSTSGSTTGLGDPTLTEVESAWCSTHSGHPCAFPFRWGSYTWNRCVPSAFGPWCATYLRGDHSYSSWGRCDPNNCKPGLM